MKQCYTHNKWRATLSVPPCYKKKGLLGFCGNYNGRKSDDNKYPSAPQPRMRRDAEHPFDIPALTDFSIPERKKEKNQRKRPK